MLPGISTPLIGALGYIAPTGGGGGTDPNFSSVVLLLGFNGANNSTGSPGMDDESLSAHGVLTNGSSISSISTSRKKFGVSSLFLNGSYVYYPDSADFNLGSGHFTVEMFVNPAGVSGTQFLVGQWNAAPNLGWILWMNNDKLSWNSSTTGSDNNFDLAGSIGITANTWHHLAIDYDGIKYRLYVNGTTDVSFATPRTLHDSNSRLSIGASHGGNFLLDPGYIDELRITKGVARYASNSGLVVPTAAFPRS